MLLLLCCVLSQPADEIVRRTVLEPNLGPKGRALPLMAHWNVGGTDGLGFAPAWQLERLDAGLPLLPWLPMPNPGAPLAPADRAALQAFARRKLPVAFMGTQWERLLAVDKTFSERPFEANARVFDAAGQPQPQLSMFGPVAPWRECGAAWGSSVAFREAQRLYPDPPRVFLFSNNEHPKLRWDQIEKDRRYVERHGQDRDPDYKRKVVAEGMIERYRALRAGFVGEFSPAWSAATRTVAYHAFGAWFFGRWPGWEQYSLHRPGSIGPFPETWDGASVPYYANNWEAIFDDQLYSLQAQAMNWVFMLDETLAKYPDFWFELSLWDGRFDNATNKLKQYADRGQDYPPERYGGTARYGLWLLRPRVLREFRSHREKRADTLPYFEAAAAAVAEVHADPVLQEFWRKGTLVANPKPHPYQAAIPDEWKDRPRWFHLDTDADPPPKWRMETRFPAFTLALVLGEAPRRRWLVLACAPAADRPGLKVSIPGYRPATVDATRGGTFSLVDEAGGTTTRVR